MQSIRGFFFGLKKLLFELMTMKHPLERNIPILYLFMFFWLALVIIPVMVPFFQSRGLSIADVYYLQAFFALIVVLFEVPSGYIADVLGRKTALVIGSTFHAAGFTWLCFAESFAGLLVFEGLVAVAISLFSGADLSMLYDSQEALGHGPKEKSRGIANMRFVKSIAEGSAALLGGFLVVYSFDAVVIANAVFAWVPLALVFFLREPPYTKMESSQAFVNLKGIIRFLYFGDDLLRLICLNTTLFSLATFYVVWMLQPYWAEQGIPLIYFGVLWAAQSFVIAAASKLCIPLEKRFGAGVILILIGALPAVGYFGMSGLGGLIGIGLSFAFFISRGLNQVMMSDALNKRIPSSFRATANSIVSFMFRGIYIVTGPMVGFLIEWQGMGVALAVLGGLVFVVCGLCLLPLLRAVKTLDPNQTVAV
ncbi:MAG: MFS family permease [Candidatus Azotimanducaceae bacterium]